MCFLIIFLKKTLIFLIPIFIFIITSLQSYFRYLVKRKLVDQTYEDNDIVICDSWKSINAVPDKVKKIIVFAHGQEYLAKKKTNLIKKSLNRAGHIICSSSYTLNLIDNLNITNAKKSVIPPTYSLKETNENHVGKKLTKKNINTFYYKT